MERSLVGDWSPSPPPGVFATASMSTFARAADEDGVEAVCRDGVVTPDVRAVIRGLSWKSERVRSRRSDIAASLPREAVLESPVSTGPCDGSAVRSTARSVDDWDLTRACGVATTAFASSAGTSARADSSATACDRAVAGSAGEDRAIDVTAGFVDGTLESPRSDRSLPVSRGAARRAMSATSLGLQGWAVRAGSPRGAAIAAGVGAGVASTVETAVGATTGLAAVVSVAG